MYLPAFLDAAWVVPSPLGAPSPKAHASAPKEPTRYQQKMAGMIEIHQLEDDTVDGSEIRYSPVKVGSLSVYPIISRVLTIPGC